ncbi:MAG: thioredoxin domain-containing protein [Candidatus Paceibacterota bacterium]|jgi:protein-disulfide isomerase|nr:thioredoxin domain-containing protein [Candidatus Paceibacterota bacterium]
MSHTYKKHNKTETSKQVEPSIKEEPIQVEKTLEPTISEDSLEKKETKPVKEMNAEIASVTVDLAKKNPPKDPPKETTSVMVPIAIVIAGLLVAGSILYTGSRASAVPKDATYQSVASQLKKGSISEEVGLDKKKFNACLESGKYTAPIKEISDAGIAAGITGTPYSIIITSSGKKFVINGAQPFNNVKAMIESALKGETKDATEVNIPPVTANDRITGNIDAPIKIVDYSDTECPFCKRFHQTMLDIMKEYGASGKVAWVYRHFPLDGLHQKARYEAEAAECAFEQGGNTKFWEYLDLMFKVTPSNDGLDVEFL